MLVSIIPIKSQHNRPYQTEQSRFQNKALGRFETGEKV
jgi:hypothetical protein